MQVGRSVALRAVSQSWGLYLAVAGVFSSVAIGGGSVRRTNAAERSLQGLQEIFTEPTPCRDCKLRIIGQIRLKSNFEGIGISSEH